MNEEIIKKIKDYFSIHKFSRAGIRNFVQYNKDIRVELEKEILNHPEYKAIGDPIYCIVKGIKDFKLLFKAYELEGLSETELREKGFFKIYDCGKIKLSKMLKGARNVNK